MKELNFNNNKYLVNKIADTEFEILNEDKERVIFHMFDMQAVANEIAKMFGINGIIKINGSEWNTNHSPVSKGYLLSKEGEQQTRSELATLNNEVNTTELLNNTLQELLIYLKGVNNNG